MEYRFQWPHAVQNQASIDWILTLKSLVLFSECDLTQVLLKYFELSQRSFYVYCDSLSPFAGIQSNYIKMFTVALSVTFGIWKVI